MMIHLCKIVITAFVQGRRMPCSQSKTGFATKTAARPHTVKKLTKKTPNSFHLDYALATTDASFKHLLRSGNKSLIVSFLNCCVPFFKTKGNNVVALEQRSSAVPTLLSPEEKSQQMMNFPVVTRTGAHIHVEMQARRQMHVGERDLYYACNAYGRQITDLELKKSTWFHNLRPVIAVQILDYDTNRMKGMKAVSETEDTLYQRTTSTPMQDQQFIKVFTLTDEQSKETHEHLQVVQLELPRADSQLHLFPPRSNFTTEEWWLSVLARSNDYTRDLVTSLELVMPEEIKAAFHQLDLKQWGSQEVVEYRKNIDYRDKYQQMIDIERWEAKKERNMEVGRALLKAGALTQSSARAFLTDDEYAKLLVEKTEKGKSEETDAI